MPDPILIGSDMISRIAVNNQKRYVKTKHAKVGRVAHVLKKWLEEHDDPVVPSGEDGAISDAVQLTPSMASQWWSNLDTLNGPQDVNNVQRFETTYTRVVTPIRIIHDEWLKRGINIQAHANGSLESRIAATAEETLNKIDDQVGRAIDTQREAHEVNLAIALYKQGASTKEPLGMNAQLTINPATAIYGVDRAAVPAFQHYVKGSTIGTSGTMLRDMEVMFRLLSVRTARSGLSGMWYPFCGGDYMQAYLDECRRNTQFQGQITGGDSVYNMVLNDEKARPNNVQLRHDPVLDLMDELAPSEKGVAQSTATVTFSGGGATRQATGFVQVDASGVVTAIVITEPGAGYTSAPTVTLGAVGGGTGATFQAKIFSTSSGASFTTVAADDYRIGTLSTVSVTAGGTGYPIGSQPNFAKRCFWLFEPAVKYRSIKGLNRAITIPADPARNRLTELQLETGQYFYNRFLRSCAVHFIV